jgi:3-phosphoshikimate 1-carboxyvinyltransferase
MSDALPSYPDKLEIVPLTRPPRATVTVPGSKSITNRALVLAALTAKGFGCTLRGVLQSEDTEIMIEALRALGFRVLTEWPESVVCISSGAEEPLIPAHQAELFVANSGTTMRFLTAVVSLGHGRYRLDGVPRMRQRPIADLLAALRELGVVAKSEAGNDCPPVIVRANGLEGGRVRIKGDVSSQFLSGLLLAAPFAEKDVTVEVEGTLVSWPYVFMTAQMLRQWGFRIRQPADLHADIALGLGHRDDWGQRVQESRCLVFEIPGRQFEALDDQRELAEAATLREGLDPRHVWLRGYDIEPDASAASYFFAAAAVTGGQVTLLGLPEKSLQGDVRFVDVLGDMGCRVERCSSGITVHGRPVDGIDVDMNDISDTVMTLAAVACFAEGPTTVRNVAHIRHKETDRLAALAAELRRLGAAVDEFADGLKITPRPLQGAEVETYNDHRMAMSLALIGLRVPGVVIKNPACVAKTYPRFFEDLEKLR